MTLRRTLSLSLLMGLLSATTAAARQGVGELKKTEWVPSSSTPGTEISLVEHKREKTHESKGVTIVMYHLAARGFERQSRYGLWIWASWEHPRRLKEVSLAEDGTVVEGDGKPVNIGVIVSRGEPFRVALESPDQSKRAFGKIVPFPIIATQGACTVEAEQVLPGFAYELSGRGFEPGEPITLSCDCKGQKMPQRIKQLGAQDVLQDDTGLTSNDKGQWSTIVAPDPKEKLDHLKLLMQGRMCAVPLDLAFGKAALKYE